MWQWELELGPSHTMAAGHLVIPSLQEKTHVAATSDGNHPREELQLPTKYLQCLVHQEFFLEMVWNFSSLSFFIFFKSSKINMYYLCKQKKGYLKINYTASHCIHVHYLDYTYMSSQGIAIEKGLCCHACCSMATEVCRVYSNTVGPQCTYKI